MSSFINEDPKNEDTLFKYPHFKIMTSFFERLFVLHAVKITLLVMFFAAISNVTALDFVFLCFLLFKVFTMKIDLPFNYLIGLFLIVFAQVKKFFYFINFLLFIFIFIKLILFLLFSYFYFINLFYFFLL